MADVDNSRLEYLQLVNRGGGNQADSGSTLSGNDRPFNPYNDAITPMSLTAEEKHPFDQAMMRLRGRNVAREILEMLKMLDRDKRGVLTTTTFRATMMASKWHLTMPETSAIIKYLSGEARIVDYYEFADLITEKLNDKSLDEKIRISRHMALFKRSSGSGAGAATDANKAKNSWLRTKNMAEKGKERQKERAAVLEAKRSEVSGQRQRAQQKEQERKSRHRDRLATSHLSYRDQANMAAAKHRQFEEDEKYRKYEALKKANEVKYDTKKRNSPTGSSPRTTATDGAVNNDTNSNSNPNSNSNSNSNVGRVGQDIDDAGGRELLFDGKIGDFGPPIKQKPFAGGGFGSLSSSLSKASLMSRPKFETWEKHINADGKIFFHNPNKKKSTWDLPPCAILVDCTVDEMVGGELEASEVSADRTSSKSGKTDDETNPLKNIFRSHPLWDQDEMLPAFNELQKIGIRSFDPTEQEIAHEHVVERVLDRQMHNSGLLPTEIKYHDLQPGMLQPSPPPHHKNPNRRVSPRKATATRTISFSDESEEITPQSPTRPSTPTPQEADVVSTPSTSTPAEAVANSTVANSTEEEKESLRVQTVRDYMLKATPTPKKLQNIVKKLAGSATFLNRIQFAKFVRGCAKQTSVDPPTKKDLNTTWNFVIGEDVTDASIDKAKMSYQMLVKFLF